MMTVDEARSAFEQYVREHPLPLQGTLHVDGWFEDADDFLPVWGAREFYVDGDPTYTRMDNLVVLIDKRSGAVRREDRFASFDKVKKMTRVASS
ncbi:hypothetical protein [Agromyces larvae]|uniref:SnoaL-like domain-containing protein n=1 Tax=Agromyces larvae TaxID=2929802 RepID=A0ABY4BXQ0_9MICO|nr:hypothetical protein [Agromyces larvae]UOE42646.1 hypothetical protein MTO99_10610 [Agromyces larvae]